MRRGILAGFLALAALCLWGSAAGAVTITQPVNWKYCPTTDDPDFGNPGSILANICQVPEPSLSGNTVFVMITCSAGSCNTPTDDKSTTYTQIESVNDAGNSVTTKLYCGQPSAGMQFITGNYSGGAGHVQMFVSQWNNISSCTASAHNHNTATGSSITGGSASPNSGDLLVMYSAIDTAVGNGFTAGSNSNITWALGGEATFAYSGWQWGQISATGAINPQFNTSTSQTYTAVWAAFPTSATGTARPAGLHFVGIMDHNSPNPTPLTSTMKIPTYGNFIVMWHSVLAGCNITSLTSSPALSWVKLGEAGNGVPVGSQQYIEFWTAKNTSPSAAMTATAVINAGCTTAQNIFTMAFDDIAGADPTNPICQSFGTSGFASSTGDQTSGPNAITTFTATPCGANNLIIVGGSLNLDSALAWTSPGCAVFQQAHYTSDNATFTNGYHIPTISDENDPNGVCFNAASLAAQTWIFPHTTDDGTFAGFWAVGGVDIVPAAAGGGATVEGSSKVLGNGAVLL